MQRPFPKLSAEEIDEPLDPQVAPSPSEPEPVYQASNAPISVEQAKAHLLAEAKKHGTADGTGKRAFVRFARLCVQGGIAQTLSGTPKSPDAKAMYNAFYTGSRQAATVPTGEIVSEDKQQSETAQLSKVRALIKLGWDYQHEAEPIFDDALKLHGQLIASPKTSARVKYRSTYSAIVSVAVKQNKVKDKVRLSPDDMIPILLIPETEEREQVGADLLISAMVLIGNAIKGRAKTENGVKPERAPVVHPSLPHLHGALKSIIAETDPAVLKEHEEEVAAAAEKKKIAAAKAAAKKAEAEFKARQAAAKAAGLAAGQGAPIGASTPVPMTSPADPNETQEDDNEDTFEPGDFDDTTERAMNEARAG